MRRIAVKALCFKKAVLFPAWIPLSNNLEIFRGHFDELMYKLGYLKDSNAAAHSVDTGIS